MHWRSARWKRIDDVCTRLLAVSRTPHSPVRWKRVINGAVFNSGAGRLIRWLGRAVYHSLMKRMDAHCRATEQGIVSGALGRHWTSRCDYEVIFPAGETHLMNLSVAVPNDLHAYLTNRYSEDCMQTPGPAISAACIYKAMRLTGDYTLPLHTQ